jgi:hypothetical protein
VLSARNTIRKAQRGDPDASNRAILPVFIPLLKDLSYALLALMLLALGVMFAEDYRFSGTLFLLAPLNAARFFVFELVMEGIAFFFFQPTITRQALRRALVPAGVWAAVYSAANTALLVVYFDGGSDADSGVPRYFMGSLYFAIAALYAAAVLVLNWGRPALRPYAWFVVAWRVRERKRIAQMHTN